jgi:hypothetical protein
VVRHGRLSKRRIHQSNFASAMSLRAKAAGSPLPRAYRENLRPYNKSRDDAQLRASLLRCFVTMLVSSAPINLTTW